MRTLFTQRKILLTVFNCTDCMDLLTLIIFKVTRKDNRVMCFLYSQTLLDSFTVIIEPIPYINLVFLLLTLNMYLPARS